MIHRSFGSSPLYIELALFMAQLYQLIPLPQGIFADLSLLERATFGLLYDRMKLSVNNHLNSDGSAFYDDQEEMVYCIYTQQALSETLGVSVRTVRRVLAVLVDKKFIISKKTRFQDANRYYIPFYIRQELKPQERGQNFTPIRSL